MALTEVCPVCKGKGIVPLGFYNLAIDHPLAGGNGIMAPSEPCKSCDGKGFVTCSEKPNY